MVFPVFNCWCRGNTLPLKQRNDQEQLPFPTLLDENPVELLPRGPTTLASALWIHLARKHGYKRVENDFYIPTTDEAGRRLGRQCGADVGAGAGRSLHHAVQFFGPAVPRRHVGAGPSSPARPLKSTTTMRLSLSAPRRLSRPLRSLTAL